jgi:hypothetical protein
VSDRRLSQTTLAVSLFLHVLLGALTMHLEIMPRFTPEALAAEPTVELMLIPDPEHAPDPSDEQPRQYTEIPDRLTSERPDQADFLAMRHSRAADRLSGGQDDQQPGSEREGEFPQVDIAPEDLAGADGVSLDPSVFAAPPSARLDREEQPTDAEDPEEGIEASGPGDMAVTGPQPDSGARAQDPADETRAEPDDFSQWIADTRTPTLLKEGRRQVSGDRGFDFRQIEQGRVGANVNIDGDFALNTYEWNFAPWMRRFTNDLHRAWIAPYAYRLGVIVGFTKIRLVVERDGRPSHLEVVDSQGHDSLHTASVSALRAFAPYAPLPADFPEDHLVILLGLHYPAWKR